MRGLKADIAAGRPPSPADELRAFQDGVETQRKADLDRAVAAADAEADARRIPGV